MWFKASYPKGEPRNQESKLIRMRVKDNGPATPGPHDRQHIKQNQSLGTEQGQG